MFLKSPHRLRLFLILTFVFICPILLGGSSWAKKKTPKRAAPESAAVLAPAVQFFAFGDWGSGTPDQKAVADQIKNVCSKKRCDFGLTLGDNFYRRGVSSVNDPQWQTKYRDLYPPIGAPLYVTLGNHDWYGNLQAQIDYSKQDSTWILPDHYYSLRYPKEGNPLLEIFVIDSMDFHKKAQEWLKAALAESKAPWKLLAFHHPILNNGKKHPPDQMKIYPKLKPIICHQMDLFVSGHEHLFSHLKSKTDECGWEQLIIGTGGMHMHGVKDKIPEDLEVKYTEDRFGFGFFEVKPTELTFTFYRATGDSPYTFALKK